jgi:hypothetical protein
MMNTRVIGWPNIISRFCAVWLAAGWTSLSVSADVARISNSWLQLGINRANGQLVELVDLASRQNFAGPASGLGGIWQLELMSWHLLKISPANARVCQVEQLDGNAPGLRMVWSDFGLLDAPNLRVEVVARLAQQESCSRWTIAVDSPGQLALARIRFPRLLDLPSLERERLALPSWAGLLTKTPRQIISGISNSVTRCGVDYPGQGSLQCLAFYSEDGPGLYLACEDTAGYRKEFAAFSEPAAGLNLEAVHLPEQMAVNAHRYTLPYPAKVGVFHGDWYNAAAIYRAWASQQRWARESRWQRGQVPAWVSRTALWVWNRGSSTNVIDAAIELQRELNLPVSVFWHWWHGCAYDTGFPEYLPPREGNGPFQAAFARAHAHDVHGLVYMNQRLWGMTTASWTNEHAVRYAVKNVDGLVAPEVYNTFTKLPCASMCLGTEFWRAKYAGLAAEALNRLGADGIYMDQACSSLACYDTRHGHPMGGGSYWMKGFQRLETDIRHRSAARGQVALAGEGCAENWLPHLDLMLALDLSRERYAAPDGWEAIPFFHAVYHGYGTFYGNYSSLTFPPYDALWPAQFAPKEPLQLLDPKFSPQFRLEQARAFIWGQQPTIANFMPSQLRERPREIGFAIQLARTRQVALKYLQDGALLAPPKVLTEEEEIPMSRLSIYAGQQEALKESVKRVPLVLASAWRAADGKIGIAIANIADRPMSATIILDSTKQGLPKRGRVYPLGTPTTKSIGEFDGFNLALKLELAPLAVRVFELRAE